MKKKELKKIEYWLDGMTSSFMVDKDEYYNWNINRSGFMLVEYIDGSIKTFNRVVS